MVIVGKDIFFDGVSISQLLKDIIGEQDNLKRFITAGVDVQSLVYWKSDRREMNLQYRRILWPG